mgnify:FL=1
MKNSKNKKLHRTLKAKPALVRLFGGRKHRPCTYCGITLSVESATFDHVKPLSSGGYDKTKNGAISCKSCNNRKGSQTKEDFLSRMK